MIMIIMNCDRLHYIVVALVVVSATTAINVGYNINIKVMIFMEMLPASYLDCKSPNWLDRVSRNCSRGYTQSHGK